MTGHTLSHYRIQDRIGAAGMVLRSNIWNQPIDGGPPKQLTHFASDGIRKRLAGVRVSATLDAVLIGGIE